MMLRFVFDFCRQWPLFNKEKYGVFWLQGVDGCLAFTDLQERICVKRMYMQIISLRPGKWVSEISLQWKFT